MAPPTDQDGGEKPDMTPPASAAAANGNSFIWDSHETRIQHLESTASVQGESLARQETKLDGIGAVLKGMDTKLDVAAGVSTDVALLKAKDEVKKNKASNLNMAIWSAAAIAGFDLALKLLAHVAPMFK
jgi:hypothetical protein